MSMSTGGGDAIRPAPSTDLIANPAGLRNWVCPPPVPPRLIRRRLLLVAFALVLVIGASPAYLIVFPRVSAHSFQSRVEVELPLGTQRSQVEAWLKKEGLPFKYIVESESGRRVGLGGTLYGICRIRLYGRRDLSYYFYFDETDRLTKVSVDEFAIGF
jgi:hypothetical protein